MYIEKVTYDNRYPYIIHDGWDGKICLTTEDLTELKELIEEELKNLTNQNKTCAVTTMTNLEKAQLLYDIFDFISDHDYSDCQNFNEFVSKVFSLTMINLDEKERNNKYDK